MYYEFKRSIRIERSTFLKGTHEVSHAIETHAHFLKYVHSGLIAEAEPPKQKSKGESFADRNKALHERLKAKREQVREPVQDETKNTGADPAPIDPPAPADTELTSGQKAAATRKANAEKAKLDAENAKLEAV